MSVSYLKQGFKNGQVLKAEHLIKMEEGIIAAQENAGSDIVIPTPDLAVNDSSDPSYVKNRTHWIEKGEVITFDGNADGRVVVEANTDGNLIKSLRFVKVSDRVPSLEELKTYYVYDDEGGFVIGDVWDQHAAGGLCTENDDVIMAALTVLVVKHGNLMMDGGTFAEPGIYLGYMDVGKGEIGPTGLHIPDRYVKIDPTYIHTPDWSQNDETAGGYIENRTHWTNKAVDITWDGNTEGHTEVIISDSDDDAKWYHVSDITIDPKYAMLCGLTETTFYHNTGEKRDYDVQLNELEEDVQKMLEYVMNLYMTLSNNTVCFIGEAAAVALIDNATIEAPGDITVTFPKAGIYFPYEKDTDSDTYITRLSIPDIVTPLEQKYVPNADWNVNDDNADGYIKNRTHYADGDTIGITWDGSTDGRTAVTVVDESDYSVVLCHVSDDILTEEDIANCSLTLTYKLNGLHAMSENMTMTEILDDYGSEDEIIVNDDIIVYPPFIFVAKVDGYIVSEEEVGLNITLPKKGVYCVAMSERDSNNEITFYPSRIIGDDIVKTLDYKFMPEGYPKAKPLTQKLTTLEFDGNTIDKETIHIADEMFGFVKISDDTPRANEFVGCDQVMTSISVDDSGNQTVNTDTLMITEEMLTNGRIVDLGEQGGLSSGSGIMINYLILVIYEDSVLVVDPSMEDINISKGVWVMNAAPSGYVSQISYYTPPEKITYLDEKFIPDTIARKSTLARFGERIAEVEHEMDDLDGRFRSIDMDTVGAIQWHMADMNQNVIGQPGYIANRTHYDGRIVNIDLPLCGMASNWDADTVEINSKTYRHASDIPVDKNTLIGGQVFAVDYNGVARDEWFRYPVVKTISENMMSDVIDDSTNDICGYSIYVSFPEHTEYVYVFNRNAVINGVSCKKGIYFSYTYQSLYTRYLTSTVKNTTYIGFHGITRLSYIGTEGEIKQLDEMYLPTVGVYDSVVLPEMTAEINNALLPTGWGYTLETPFVIEDGKTYTVTWDGVEYECVGTAVGTEMVALGNINDGHSNEPFAFFCNTTRNEYSVTSHLSSGAHTFSITTETKKIKEEYIPDSVYELINELRAEIETLKAQISNS